jgi:hypothetical protein
MELNIFEHGSLCYWKFFNLLHIESLKAFNWKKEKKEDYFK